jgi:serine/threonine protein kinase
MSWPALSDYSEAIQHPPSAFNDPELKNGKPEEWPTTGLPRPITGAFASVYQMHCGNRQWAVRCFSRECTDQQERYRRISDYLHGRNLPFMVGFEFLANGIRIKKKMYPILRMEWVDGDMLDKYVHRNLGQPANLKSLAQQWVQVLASLHEAKIAHGDLQHGNILVSQGKIKLIDYDGMFVPTLSGWRSNEEGQPNYQPPTRTDRDFGPFLDGFSGWIILLSLSALSVDPGLWQRLNGGDECLLFRRADFESPTNSPAFQSVLRSPDPQLRGLAKFVMSLVRMPLSQTPSVTLAAASNLPEVGSTNVGVPEWVTPRQVPGFFGNLAELAPVPALTPINTEGAAWLADHLGDTVPPVSVWTSVTFKTERMVVVSSLLITLFVIVGLALFPLWLAILLEVIVIAGTSAILFAGFQKLPYLDDIEVARNLWRISEGALIQAEQALAVVQSELSTRKNPLSRLRHEYETLPVRFQAAVAKQGQRITDLLSVNQTALRSLDADETRKINQIKDQLQRSTAQLLRRKAELDSQQQAELAAQLQPLRDQFVQGDLYRHKIQDAGLRGISSVLVSRLESYGFHSANDVLRSNVRRVEGIGEKKAAVMNSWAQSLRRNAEFRAPTTLPAAAASQITAKYQALRQQTGQDRMASFQYDADTAIRSTIDRNAQQRQALFNERTRLEQQLNDSKLEVWRKFENEKERLAREYTLERGRVVEIQKQYESRTRELSTKVMQAKIEAAKAEREVMRYASLNFREFLVRIIGIK